MQKKKKSIFIQLLVFTKGSLTNITVSLVFWRLFSLLKLKKAIYGLKQAPQAIYLISTCFNKYKFDSSLFNSGFTTYVLVYIDDIIIVDNHISSLLMVCLSNHLSVKDLDAHQKVYYNYLAKYINISLSLLDFFFSGTSTMSCFNWITHNLFL